MPDSKSATEIRYSRTHSLPLTREQQGKVYALRRAGWTVQEIADDLSRYEEIIRPAAFEFDADPDGTISRYQGEQAVRAKKKGKRQYQKYKEQKEGNK